MYLTCTETTTWRGVKARIEEWHVGNFFELSKDSSTNKIRGIVTNTVLTAPIKEAIPFHTTIKRQQSLKSRVQSYTIVGVTIKRQQCLKNRVQSYTIVGVTIKRQQCLKNRVQSYTIVGVTIKRQQCLMSRVRSYTIVGVTIKRQQSLKSRVQKLHNCRRQTSRCPSDGFAPREKEAEEAQSS
ncbi:hypothetical protein Pcinc_019775 [Petrolisthes cinctipes]|uniref:Uncharacterized protein n=1 Tax=Petrolisthes cinctipes TaxID=88211 RepID=A0AAE1FKB3_PETCI|nr:hypothetical protein Pcinc_019775 [Petrolisthes cinctipes]